MNPRYLAYCAAHGMTPEAMAAHDVKRWPGGRSCGFILWIHARAAEFNALPAFRGKGGPTRNQDAFTAHCESVALGGLFAPSGAQ